jgi:uroporphyrinogen-III decarboxylase
MTMTETAAELYQQREKRVLDAIALRVPDRVPLLVFFAFFPARYCGLTIQELMYDPEKLFAAQWKTMIDFAPDMDNNPFGLRLLGPILETLDFKPLKWPGHGVTANRTYQYIEGEYMKAEEYDHFLLDPTDFMIRRFWPRIMGGLSGFQQLPPLHNIISYYLGISMGFRGFAQPEVKAALETLVKAGEKSQEIAAYALRFSQQAREAGFPMQFGAVSQAPFDTLSDFFRGMKGTMLDLYRRPEKVVQACEKLLPFMIEMAVNGTRATGNPRVFIPIHWGLDNFMSKEQFDRFFWPTLRDLMHTLIKEGLNPCPLWEGNCTTRLETIKDIPAGKACHAFEATDMVKAKEILGDTVCIRGNVPLSIMATGTPDQVRVYCKKLIDTVAKGGGYIMDTSTGLDDAKPENVRALFDFTREYGVY